MHSMAYLQLLTLSIAAAVTSSPIASASITSTTANITKRATGAGFTPGTVSWPSSTDPDSQQPIVSLDNGIDYFFQSDGNLVVIQNGNVQWASYAFASCANAACRLTFQGDGNFVATDGSGKAFWTTGTNSYAGHYFSANQLYFTSASPWIQLYDQNTYLLWQTSGNSGSISNNPEAQKETGLGYVPGESFPSNSAPIAELHNGIIFYFAQDGNIVVSQQGSGQVYWSSGSGGRNCGNGGCSLSFLKNGDLAAIDNTYNPPVTFWHTATNRAPPAYHSEANELFFQNTPPYISLYEGDGQGDNLLLWETTGTAGYRRIDQDGPEKGSGGGGGGGNICSQVPCVSCDFGCGGNGGSSDPQPE